MGKTSICMCACTGARAVWKAGLVKHGKRSLQSWEEKEKIEEKEETTATKQPSKPLQLLSQILVKWILQVTQMTQIRVLLPGFLPQSPLIAWRGWILLQQGNCLQLLLSSMWLGRHLDTIAAAHTAQRGPSRGAHPACVSLLPLQKGLDQCSIWVVLAAPIASCLRASTFHPSSSQAGSHWCPPPIFVTAEDHCPASAPAKALRWVQQRWTQCTDFNLEEKWTVIRSPSPPAAPYGSGIWMRAAQNKGKI